MSVELARGADALTLTVTDAGVDEAPSAVDNTGLGQRLIRSMAKQLQGAYQVAIRAAGRTCQVRFLAAARQAGA